MYTKKCVVGGLRLHVYFILVQLLNIIIACDGTSVLGLDLGEKY